MRGANSRAGLTLIELLVVLVVCAFLASGAIVLFSSGYTDRAAEEAAGRIAADIRFAQAQAIASRSEHLVVFDETRDAYLLFGRGDTLWHPVTKKPFCVDLAGAFGGSGIDLVRADFGDSDTLRFDEDGIPASGGHVAVQGGECRWSVSVADVTGRIALSEAM